MGGFKKELRDLINKYSIENICDIPDFLLAQMICDMIAVMGAATKVNLDWHCCDSVCHPASSKAQTREE